ncbi:NAD(P)/FAD-dependent oxidoreductase [Fulvivirga sp. M361]|uniref:NAD(P)/FAD-dependent oxidoreductase n=1 Tax=Fulvivirga sp. M361 TaxID=2594266 RepID=UPI001179B117|nr:FAD/NAD(P)-binding oxidoreductase [Fulvivirga sp. M361]TRX55539.1 NAD(P)/FAD-dependent oxidoreductase [Fulvivirga sp. M361]
MKHIVIVGNGVSGITAARHIRKNSDFDITVISAETDHFWSRTALMYIYMGHMKFENTKPYEDWFWKKNRINLINDYVEQIDPEAKNIKLTRKGVMDYDALILATGAKPNKFGWPGQDLEGVSGMVSYQDLQYIEKHSKGISRAVIVGGGLIGVEMAEMFHSRKIDVTFLVREKQFWNNVLPQQEASLISRHILENHIDLRLGEELKEILADDKGHVKRIITGSGEEIACQFVGLTAGVHPNINLAKASGIETDRGILVNEYLETNQPDIYAIGDCAQRKDPLPSRRPIEQVWYTGRMMGETVAQTITGNRSDYKPGHWFNSAKFFDIEYQTYGWVWNQLKENEEEFYWEHKSGKKCMHFIFDKSSKKFLGVNTFGIRLRHESFDKWLNEERDIYHVLENLREANFDPEFFDRHEQEISDTFNHQFPQKPITLKGKKSLLESIFG